MYLRKLSTRLKSERWEDSKGATTSKAEARIPLLARWQSGISLVWELQKQGPPYQLDDSFGYSWIQHKTTRRRSYHCIKSDSCITFNALLVKLCNKGWPWFTKKSACWLCIRLYEINFTNNYGNHVYVYINYMYMELWLCKWLACL